MSNRKHHRDVRKLQSALFELLESRQLMTASPAPVYPDYQLTGPTITAPAASATPAALSPSQVRGAYGLNTVGNGAGETIAIVDAYDDPDAQSDLHNFDVQFGLPDPSFKKLNENGGTTLPGTDPKNGWEVEESLDIEWAHVAAPGASIVLIEASSPDNQDMIDHGVNTARKLPGVVAVSMSFGGYYDSDGKLLSGEQSGDASYNQYFTTPSGHEGVTFLAAAGDTGAVAQFPSTSPDVVAVGGTDLSVSSSGTYQGESAWSDGGGGLSTVEGEPAYQKSVVTQTSTQRAVPDVAMIGGTGVSVYDSYNGGTKTPWLSVTGTSLATPMFAGVVAIADQSRAQYGFGSLDGATQTLPRLYGLPSSDFHDIVTGNSGYAAKAGYDLVTGRGTPIASSLVADLAGNFNAIAAEYLATGYETDAYGVKVQSLLGSPTSAIMNVPGMTDALMQTYQDGGAIYWSPSTGAHVVYGGIGYEYQQLANETDAYGRDAQTVMGLPTSDEANVSGVSGARFNNFQGGAIYWSPSTGARAVYGGISGTYNNLGGPRSSLGLPVDDETGTASQRVQNFQNGYVVWTPTAGAIAYAGNYTALAGHLLQGVTSAPMADGRQVMFARGGDNQVYYRIQSLPGSTSWGAWELLGGSVTSVIATQGQNGQIQVFAIGGGGEIYVREQAAANEDSWLAWHALGGSGVQQIVATQNQDGRAQLFARMADDSVSSLWQWTSGAWSGLTPLEAGYNFTSISVNRGIDGCIVVAGVGFNGALFVNTQAGANDWFGGFVDLGGSLITRAVVAQNADGQAQVFVVGGGNTIWVNTQSLDGNWTGFSEIGGGATFQSISVGLNDGYVNVVAVGWDSKVYVSTQKNGFTTWTSHGGAVSQTSVGENADGSIMIFALDTDQSTSVFF